MTNPKGDEYDNEVILQRSTSESMWVPSARPAERPVRLALHFDFAYRSVENGIRDARNGRTDEIPDKYIERPSE